MTMDNRYAVGAFCTWHDFLSHAVPRGRSIDGAVAYFVCPRCNGEVTEVALSDWLGGMAREERKSPGAEAMMLWSRGRCFPDHDTLVNAYRQAMDE